MNMIGLIDRLRKRIAEYRADKINDVWDEFELTCCTAIERAIIYAELFYKIERKISSHEIIVFQGGRFISDIIGSEEEYADIYHMYYDLCNEINRIYDK